jgi:phospholipase C
MQKPFAALCAALAVVGTFPTPTFAQEPATRTPVKHVIVIFNENISFDHYFGTYPLAKNLSGETPFWGSFGAPADNLMTPLNPNFFFAPEYTLNLLTNKSQRPQRQRRSL